MLSKEEKIQQFLQQPIKVGDRVQYNGEGNGSKDKSSYTIGTVIDITELSDTNVVLKIKGYYNAPIIRRSNEVIRDVSHIGNNPFKEEIRYDSWKTTLDSLLFECGEGKNKDYNNYPEVNYNPTVFGKPYQRDYVWTLQQKQALIDSIYNNVDIGKFTFKFNNYENSSLGHKDIIDGKQRLLTLIEFVNNKFKDSLGNYWNDLSTQAQQRFYSSTATIVKLDGNASDEAVIKLFLAINHTGEPMSIEHINYIKQLNNEKI